MADHLRTQIRNAVAAKLAGLPTTGDRVYIGRTRPLTKNYEPSLLIYTPGETSRRAAAGSPPILERPAIVVIEGRVSMAGVPDDMLDQIAAEVEAAMTSDLSLGGLAYNLQFQATDVDTKSEGERQLGGIRLAYLVTYRTAEGRPTIRV